MDIAALIAQMNGNPRPALIYVSQDERLELSYHVMANWMSKIANLVTLDCGAEVGQKIVIDLPVHWRAIAWTGGAWTSGLTCASSIFTAEGEVADDVIGWVSNDAHKAEDIVDSGFSGDMWLQALPSLALAWPGELPAGVEDATQSIMSCADALIEPADKSGVPSPSEIISKAHEQIVTNRKGSPITVTHGSVSDVTQLVLLAWQANQCVVVGDDSYAHLHENNDGLVIDLAAIKAR
ncbi:MAG: TIGR03089 family protein [Actinomycetaceae bacterium]|nr:TIGR03089 family protein [Actinomycetaceae bacterium]